jgi:hypothetical protein
MKTQNAIYNQLFKLTEKKIVNYREDLTEIDKRTILKNGKTKFIHISRRNGTSMINFYKSEIFPKEGEKTKHFLDNYATRKNILDSNFTTLKFYLENEPLAIYFFDGEKLLKINSFKAIELFNKYKNALLNQWSEEEEKKEILNY